MALRRSARVLKRTHNTESQTTDSLAESANSLWSALTLEEFCLLNQRHEIERYKTDEIIERLFAKMDFLDFYSRETLVGLRDTTSRLRDIVEPRAKRAGLDHRPQHYSLGERMDAVCPLLDREPGRFWCRPRYGIYLLDYDW